MKKFLSILLPLLEISLLFAWTLWVCRAYLNMDPLMWPGGGEFGLAVRSHSIWVTFQKCGLCFLWNGSVRGGYPAFGELQGAVLHPLVILSTMIAGVANGAKITLIGSFFMAGFAQWWIAKSLKLGFVARVWSPMLVVVGGHLASRMAIGMVGIILSTASSALAIGALVNLVIQKTQRAAIIFSTTLALLILSGQGYLQIGFLLGVVPALIIFVVNFEKRKIDPIWKKFLLAGVLALLLCAVLILPLVHFYPNLDKFSDEGFSFSQQFSYVPLNLVIDDINYYASNVLKSLPYLDRFDNFLGWFPVLLSILALRYSKKENDRFLWFFILSVFLIFFATSSAPLKWLIPYYPQIQTIRFPHWFAGIANTMIMALAAMGLDGVIKVSGSAPPLFRKVRPLFQKYFSLRNILVSGLLFPMIFAIDTAYQFGQPYLQLHATEVPMDVVRYLPRDKAYWISVSEFEHYWNVTIPEMGLKLGEVMSPYKWKNKPTPPTMYYMSVLNHDYTVGGTFVQKGAKASLYIFPRNAYAFVQSGIEKYPCEARSLGGNIDVVCDAKVSGVLFVTENYWTGWTAQRDGVTTPLSEFSTWLSVLAPAGKHSYTFRYQPWDVWVGLGLSLMGMVLSGWLWFRKEPGRKLAG
jgi:hypothetical protein